MMRETKELYEALCEVFTVQGGRPGWSGWLEDDWPAFASLAEAQGVAPLVYWAFQQAGWPVEMPKSAQIALSKAYYANMGYYTMLLGELERVLQAFAQANIPVMVLKGIALAQEVYLEPSTRRMNDLDLLVHGKDVEAALQALRTCGYHMQKAIYHMAFVGGPRQQVAVELHWSLMRRDSGYADRLWKRGCAWRVNAEHAPEAALALRLNPLDNLLYLSTHLMLQHAGDGARLLWYYDIHLLLRRYSEELDWACLLAEAEASGRAQPLFQALEGVRERFGDLWLPEGFMKELERLSASGVTPVHSEDWVQQWTWDALCELGWRARLRLGLGLLLPHPEYMRWRYQPKPAWLWPATYPLRWWLLAREWLDNVLRASSS